MKQYQYILFDWDGTLAKTLDIWHDALSEALSKTKYSFSKSEIGANYELFKGRFEARGYSGADNIINDALEIASKKIPNTQLYSGAKELLVSLHNNGKHIALVTTSLHKQIDPLLKLHNLTDIFEAVVCADDTEKIKPNPQPVLKAMKLLNADPSQTILIGDSESDLLASSRSNIDSILFYPESHAIYHNISKLSSLNPTYTVASLIDLNKGMCSPRDDYELRQYS